jgi:P pilus assembly chaperone PapD
MRYLLLAALVLATACAPQPPAQRQATQASQADRRVRLVNNSSKTIMSFYASNVRRDRWEEDILGNRTVAPGQSVSINIDDGTGACNFDFKTVMRGGQEVVKRNVDVCRVATYTISD